MGNHPRYSLVISVPLARRFGPPLAFLPINQFFDTVKGIVTQEYAIDRSSLCDSVSADHQ
jgi:hypothetical protein